jgi:myosin heavy subunit
MSLPEQSIFILKKLIPGIEKVKNSYQLGNTKIYLREEHEIKLNELMLREYQKRDNSAMVIQRQVRRYHQRR